MILDPIKLRVLAIIGAEEILLFAFLFLTHWLVAESLSLPTGSVFS